MRIYQYTYISKYTDIYTDEQMLLTFIWSSFVEFIDALASVKKNQMLPYLKRDGRYPCLQALI